MTNNPSDTSSATEQIDPMSPGELDPEARERMRFRALVASTVGTTIEWYDFFLYGIVAGLVFPQLFFPGSDPFIGTLLAFSTFFVGFAARPLGAIIFGHFGDRFGRKASLVATMLLMGIATVVIGLIPGYDQIGIWGAVLLVIGRSLQGIGVGGEWGGAILMAGEWTDPKRRGFAMSWPQFGGPAGLLLANGAFSLMLALTTEEQFQSWGWRLPFLASVVLIGVGLYIRLGILETPVFAKLQSQGKLTKAPVVEVVRHNWREIVLVALMRTGQMAPFYIFITYILAYGTQQLELDRQLLLNLVMGTAALSLVATPILGYLSDIVGRRRMIMTGCFVMVVYPFLYFSMIDSGVFALLAIAMVLSEPLHDIQYAPQAAFIAENFPGSRRYSGVSLGYQLAGITAGGPAPIIALYLFNRFQSSMAIAVFMAITAIISLLALLMMRDRAGALDQQ